MWRAGRNRGGGAFFGPDAEDGVTPGGTELVVGLGLAGIVILGLLGLLLIRRRRERARTERAATLGDGPALLVEDGRVVDASDAAVRLLAAPPGGGTDRSGGALLGRPAGEVLRAFLDDRGGAALGALARLGETGEPFEMLTADRAGNAFALAGRPGGGLLRLELRDASLLNASLRDAGLMHAGLRDADLMHAEAGHGSGGAGGADGSHAHPADRRQMVQHQRQHEVQHQTQHQVQHEVQTAALAELVADLLAAAPVVAWRRTPDGSIGWTAGHFPTRRGPVEGREVAALAAARRRRPAATEGATENATEYATGGATEGATGGAAEVVEGAGERGEAGPRTFERFRLELNPGTPGTIALEAIEVPARDGGSHGMAVDAAGALDAERSLARFVRTMTETFAHLNVGLGIFDQDQRLVLFNPALGGPTRPGWPGAHPCARPSTACAPTAGSRRSPTSMPGGPGSPASSRTPRRWTTTSCGTSPTARTSGCWRGRIPTARWPSCSRT